MVYKSVSTNFDFTVGCWDERKWFLAGLIGLIIPGVPDTTPPQEPFILGPGATQLLTFEQFSATMTQQTYQDIAGGVTDLKFAGTVTYEDIFGESHSITCKGLLDPKTGRFLLGDVDPRIAR
jgi:hypothetical protein